ncbi:trimeric intracellular cation channel type 1B.2 [Aplysia californica]|uniref:Trimeric intracellular cation channel type 1B.2 n=1 Tax=Aplysia californica TaxID=6500 RepID=A0ABM0JVH5_APLCA|nr:trimeric intracellular cation channel type 1B.2 [Aplysia californica]
MAAEVSQFAKWVMEVDMFPVFFGAHFLLASTIVREDSKDLGPRFRQEHPFAMWFCTIMAGLSGVFVANFLFGDPLVDVMKENALIIYLTLVWYLMNYSPYDAVYKIALSPPVFLSASVLQECLRVRFIFLGLKQAARVYPGAYIIILLGGVIKGNGYGFIRVVERLIRGKWNPGNNDILEVTYFAKSGLYASFLFLLHHFKFLNVPIEFLYLGVVAVFIICRMLTAVAGIKDPFLPIELPICRVLFGSTGKEKVAAKDPVKDKLDKKKN